MKLVKSLLLGSAAVLAAVAVAEAADLPVKKAAVVAPVNYVKICDAYGSGFFYIPGTDTCLKVGGYVRAEWQYTPGTNQITVGAIGATTLPVNAGTFTATNPTGLGYGNAGAAPWFINTCTFTASTNFTLPNAPVPSTLRMIKSLSCRECPPPPSSIWRRTLRVSRSMM